MKKLGTSAAGIVLAGMAAFAAPVQANLVTNGGFETGDLSGWVSTGDSTSFGAICDDTDPTIFAGSCLAYFGSSAVSGIEQSVHVGQAGLTWNLSFAFKPDGGTPSSFEVLCGGQTLLSLTNPAAGDYTLYQFSGLTTADNMTLAFHFVDPVGFLFLDAVSVTAVPEPATMGMMGAGLAGLMFLRRRKTA